LKKRSGILLKRMPVQLQVYKQLLEELKEKNATLIAVSKTKPASDISELYAAGQRDFGENYVQELVDKEDQLPKDIRWHFIGHLQRNKVKQIAGLVHLIHGVDSLRLLEEINKQAAARNKKISVLLQMFIADEETKFGLDQNELKEIVALLQSGKFPNIELKGLMGMASFTDDQQKVTREFSMLQQTFLELKKVFPELNTLSMGMSGDYKIALQYGSTMIRIGSALFGARG
jgi:pyridoxal phosphate enzyme (YggS family)